MPELVYALCAATSLFCAALLLRGYLRQRTRILMWSTLCFIGLAINNVVLFVDLVIVPDVDLSILRAGVALAAVGLLLIGLLWEES